MLVLIRPPFRPFYKILVEEYYGAFSFVREDSSQLDLFGDVMFSGSLVGILVSPRDFVTL